MTSITTPRGATLFWIVTLTGAALFSSWALACAAPLAALAALAATQLSARDGLLMMVLAWGMNQLVGFTLLGYPHDPATLAWGVGIGTAALASIVAARFVDRRFGAGKPIAARLALAFVAAFVAEKAALSVWALLLGGIETTLSPVHSAEQFLRDGLVTAALYAFYRGAVALGAPRAGRVAAA